MPRGRPTKSQVRQNLIEILYHIGNGYGYDLYKVYAALFPKVTMRLIYYHLQKGVALGEIKTNKIVAEKGNFSWGSEVEKTYYELGANAKPLGDKKVKDFVEQWKNKDSKELKQDPSQLKS